MARARLLKPGFFSNELLAECSPWARLLFAGLWTLADREGRLEARDKRIKAAVFPFDEVDVGEHLAALEQRGFIERYTVNAMPLIQIAKFLEHQQPHKREPASTLPPSPAFSGTGPAVFSNGSSSVCGNGSRSAESLSRSSPPVLVFPTQGQPDSWALYAPQIAEWQGLFPGLDIHAECRQALAWVKANPGRGKTARGMPSFLVRWFGRSVDRRSGSDRRGADPSPMGKQTTRLAGALANIRAAEGKA